jgi:hypothetical protein
MEESPPRVGVEEWNGEFVHAGKARDVRLTVSESYSGMTVTIPLYVKRGLSAGPTLFVSAACHGDEINGTGAIRTLVQDETLKILRGAVIFAPVLNILGFDRHSRYLPDRRDLNRCFPGSSKGSLARRMARVIFDQIVSRCNYGIDLHTAAIRRTNFPNVRGDLNNPVVRRLARAFGAEFIVHGEGPQGSLRREACAAGCPTIILEGGEIWKVEPAIVDFAVRGVRNVLRDLEMISGSPEYPPRQWEFHQTRWIRADRGGFLRFHVTPGEVVRKGQPLATNASLLGRDIHVLPAPFDSVVLGVTTLPAVSPGEPVYHLARLTPEQVQDLDATVGRVIHDDVHEKVRDDLATHLHVVEPQ